MAKFRNTNVNKTKTVNLAGGQAYKESTKLELVSLLLTSFVNDKFYEKSTDQLDRLANLVKTIPDKKFVAKAAIYARNEFGMRSITHALAAELVKEVKEQSWTKVAISKIVKRADDMLEILAYYADKYGKPIPNSLKKGLRLAIGNFNSYELAKYKGSKSTVKMVDLVNLVHPKGNDKNTDALKKLIVGELKSTETWEAKLSDAGQKVSEIADETEKAEKLTELKKDAWKGLLETKKLGYFALLRNLRNIIEQAPDCLDMACEQLVDKESIKRSLVMPFRFQTAINEVSKVSGSRKAVKAISDALDLSVMNVPKFEGKTLIALDESGSMAGKAWDIGSLFAAVLFKANEGADLLTFGNDARYQRPNPNDSVSTIAKSMDPSMGGTNFHSIFDKAAVKYDRVIILSDMQGWMERTASFSFMNTHNAPLSKTFTDYKKRTGADPKIFSFDLNGYGTLQFPENNVFCIAGFSEKIFDVMKLLEEDREALINKIEQIEL